MASEELEGVKFSEFPSQTPVNADEVVGLHSGDNARFSIANIVAAVRNGLANIFVPKTDVGAANGVAELDNTGKVPSSQLPPISSDAADIIYDPTTSGLTATNVQDAIDEVYGDIPSQPSDIGAQDEITSSGILKGDGAGGVSAAVAGADYQAPLTIDATPTENSTNPVQSGGVYTDVRTRVPVYGMGKNLLRNWYFVGGGTGRGVFPVNQRGLSSYSNGVGVDGWITRSNMTMTTQASGIKLSYASPASYADFYQFLGQDQLNYLSGKTVTLTILGSFGYWAFTFTWDTTGQGSLKGGDFSKLVVYAGGTNKAYTNMLFRVYINNSEIYGIKLELGTEQTLCHQENGVWVLNEIPDYEEELIKCQTSTADSSDTYANKSLAMEQQLAYVETGTTASHNYTAGQYISLNGLLYTADTAIASGATFYTSGGNKNLTECVGGGLNSNSIHRAAIPLYNAPNLFTLARGFGIAKFYGGNNGTTAVLTRTEQGSSKSRTISVGASSWENIPVVAGDTITYYGGPYANGEIYYITHHIGS